MKKKLLLFFFIFSFSFSFSQEVKNTTDRFLNPEIVSNFEDYSQMFSKTNMSIFRYENKNHIFKFQSGLKDELLIINTLKNKIL